MQPSNPLLEDVLAHDRHDSSLNPGLRRRVFLKDPHGRAPAFRQAGQPPRDSQDSGPPAPDGDPSPLTPS